MELFAIQLPQGIYDFYRSLPFELHPAVVHFPIALLVAAFLFDLLYVLTKRASLEGAGFWCLLFGLITGVLAIGTGLAEEGTLGHHTERGHELMERHELLGLGLGGLFLVLTIWRLATRGLVPLRARALYLLLMLAGAVGLGLQGYLGGEMVFSETLGVEMDAMKEVVAAGTAGHHHGSGEAEAGAAGPTPTLPMSDVVTPAEPIGTPLIVPRATPGFTFSRAGTPAPEPTHDPAHPHR